MIKKLILSIFFLCFCLKIQAYDFPTQFFVKRHWFSLTSTFEIESSDYKMGTVDRKLLSWTPYYYFFDINNQLQAKAKMRFFNLGATFDIWNAQDEPLGRVDERIFRILTYFDLYRADGLHVAAAKLNFWETKYTIRDPQTNEVIAYLSRKFLRLKSDWTVDIVNPTLLAQKEIDPRFFILVMAFQSDREGWTSLCHLQSNGPNKNLTSQELLSTYQSLESHREKLESYRKQLADVGPTDQEIFNLEEIVEKQLAAYEFSFSEDPEEGPQASLEWVRLRAKEQGIAVLMPLFDSDDLTPGQKSGLFLLMDQALN